MFDKFAFIIICLLTFFFGNTDGLKCYFGYGEITGNEASNYAQHKCFDHENACITIECTGEKDGKVMKGCYEVPAGQDFINKCPGKYDYCNLVNVGTSGGKNCRSCQGDLCNTDYIVTPTPNATTSTIQTTKTMTIKTTTPSSTTTTTPRTTTQRKTTTSNDCDCETNDQQENGLTFDHQAFPLLIAIGAVIAAVGHFLVF